MKPEVLEKFLHGFNDLLQKGNIKVANVLLDQMLVAHPKEDRLLHEKMKLFARAKNYESALAVVIAMSTAYKSQPELSRQIVALFKGLKKIKLIPDLEAEICRLLQDASADCSSLSELIHTVFYLKIGQLKQQESYIKAIDKDPLIHAVLRNFWLRTEKAERICTDIRAELLALVQENASDFSSLAELPLSIAHQCHQNEYVYFVSGQESDQLDDLRENIQRGFNNSDGNADSLLSELRASLMYLPPRALLAEGLAELSEMTGIDGAFMAFIERDLEEQELLRTYSQKFLLSSSLDDETSLKVSKMYVENPYPRWTKVPVGLNAEKKPYPVFYELNRSPYWQEGQGKEYTKMLVAGCGTGFHPVVQAIAYPWLEITAIDISPSSLAYGQLMAKRLGIDNINFQQMDIMSLGDWQERFDIIESVGVLHHLKEPAKGLANLRRLATPGAIFRLGYYSRIARQAIVSFRADHPVGEWEIDDEFIRNLRQRFFTDPEFEKYQGVTAFGDFYSVSGCRDLIMHEQESQYSISELQEELANAEINFVSFTTADITRFRSIGISGSPYDLSAWERAEEAEPRLFQGMYQFYGQVPF